jgi:hypothetical protein
MRGERYQNGMAILAIVLLVFGAVPLTVNVPGLWFLWGPTLASLVVLPAIFLRESDLATGLRAPSQARETLVAGLRAAGVAVTMERDAVRARMNALSAVDFRTRTTDQGTVLSFQPRASPAGWAVLIALVASIVGSAPAIVLSFLLFRRATQFARAHAPSAFQGAEASPASRGPDDVHAMLVGSLSSGLGMVRTAFEAQRKAYTDALALVGVAAFTVFIAVLVGLFVALNGFNLATGQWDVPILVATTATAVLVIVLLVALRRRYAPRLTRYRGWIDRLANAFDGEMSRRPAEPAAASTFELLADASTQVPDWLEAQRRAGLSGDPGTSGGILLATLFSASSFMYFVIDILRGRLDAAAIEGVLGAGAAGTAAWIYRRWKKGEDARLVQSRVAWDAHLAALRSRMDRFFEEM